MKKNYNKKQAVKKTSAPRQRSINFTALKWISVGALLGISVIVVVPHLPLGNLANQMKNFSLSSAVKGKKETLPPVKNLEVTAEKPQQTTKPSFDFYTLLPEMKVDVPAKEERNEKTSAAVTSIAAAPQEAHLSTAKSQPAKVATNTLPPTKSFVETPKQAPKKGGSFSLQIASFKNFSDADATKTQLLVSGFPVRLQTSTLSGGQTLHLIKLGPYKDKNFAQRDRQRLMAMNYRQTVIVEE